jgi:F0F1-type ATP synthase assembly protein I
MSQVDPSKMSRRRQIVETYRLTKQQDPAIGLWLLGAFVLGAVLGFVLFTILPGTGVFGLVMAIIGALLGGFIAAMILFGRRAQKAAYQRMEGQPGAAAAALTMLRRGWTTEPAVAFNKQQDVVHRVVGPPGIVLVGEGNANRLRPLLTSERKRHERVLYEVPVSELIVGDGEGQVPLPKLVRTVMKMDRKVKPAEITDLLNRLKAIDNTRGKVPLPKGPVPTSMKGMRGNLRGR